MQHYIRLNDQYVAMNAKYPPTTKECEPENAMVQPKQPQRTCASENDYVTPMRIQKLVNASVVDTSGHMIVVTLSLKYFI